MEPHRRERVPAAIYFLLSLKSGRQLESFLCNAILK
jgi:hypothetical protein